MSEPDEVVIRRLGEKDLAAVADLQTLTPTAAHWDPMDYLSHESWVAELDREVVGFLILQIVAPDEGEILNLAVHPLRQRYGIATRLLDMVPPLTLYLEVRASNRKALNFYKKQGFLESGRRKGYYTLPPEDAVVMRRAAKSA